MKNILLIIFSVVTISCSTLKITVYGEPNTTIKTPNNEYLGRIESNGSTKIKLDRYHHYAYLLTVSPETNKEIPFALEYTPKPGRGDWTFATKLLSCFVPPVGLIYIYCFPDPLEFSDIEYNYKYHNKQETNSDLLNQNKD